jgi:hypothetical protein
VSLELELGVEDDDESLGEDELLLELGVLLEPALGVPLLEELELGGVEDPEPDIELEEDGGVLDPDEDEDDGLEGAVEGDVVLDEDDPADDLSAPRDAPGAPVRSQP